MYVCKPPLLYRICFRSNKINKRSLRNSFYFTCDKKVTHRLGPSSARTQHPIQPIAKLIDADVPVWTVFSSDETHTHTCRCICMRRKHSIFFFLPPLSFAFFYFYFELVDSLFSCISVVQISHPLVFVSLSFRFAPCPSLSSRPVRLAFTRFPETLSGILVVSRARAHYVQSGPILWSFPISFQSHASVTLFPWRVRRDDADVTANRQNVPGPRKPAGSGKHCAHNWYSFGIASLNFTPPNPWLIICWDATTTA